MPRLSQRLAQLIQQEKLPASYGDTVRQIVLPLADAIRVRQEAEGRPLLVGIHGAQGTGKSTLALFLKAALTDDYNCPCAGFSLDDIYLTRSRREQLARTVHPLLKTRGVPGTHDLTLGYQVIERLQRARPGSETRIPAFDKASDDRCPYTRWPIHKGEARVILLEGWCLGVQPQTSAELAAPVNELEAREDVDGRWRQQVNEQLEGPYGAFFGQIDLLIMLQAPSMESVIRWRTLQEHKLARKLGDAPEECSRGPAVSLGRAMTDTQIQRFVAHYERITRAALAEMPDRADVLLTVEENHQISGMLWKGKRE